MFLLILYSAESLFIVDSEQTAGVNMASHSLSVDQYGEELSDALYKGLCIRDFPCQEAERHNKPEVEFGTCRELLLPPITVSRQSGDACCIESSMNSCRVSFKFREGDILDRALAHGFFRYLGLKAEDLPILRRKPSVGYQVSFLVTAALLKHHKVPDIVRFLVSFALDTPAFLRELKCAVNAHTRSLAAAAVPTRSQASLAEELRPELSLPEAPGHVIGTMASQIHEQQMQDFAQLVNGRRKLHVKEVEIVVEEFKEARVQTGAILSADDLASLLNDLASEVLEVVEREVQSAFELGTAMAQNLCLCAEQHSIALVVDVARLESRDVLQNAANIHLVATSAPSQSKSKLSPVSNTMRIGALPTLRAVQEDGRNTKKELESARIELEATQAKLAQVHEHAMSTMRAKSALAEEIDHLKAKLESLLLCGRDKALSTAATDTSHPAVESLAAAFAEAEQLRQANLQLTAQLEEAKAMQQAASQEAQSRKEQVREQLSQLSRKDDELQHKVSETKQVKQLMEMLQKKSQEVGLLRKRLIQYEPEYIPDADR